MGVLDSVYNMFSRAPQQPQVANTNQPGQILTVNNQQPIQQTPGAQTNNLVPGSAINENVGRNPNGENPSGQTLKQDEQSPLAEYADLFTIEPKSQQPQEVVSFDEKKFTDAVGKMDFAKTVSPELMQKALSGDVQALADIINHNSRSVLSMSGKMAASLVKDATNKTRSSIESNLPSRIVKQQVNANLVKDNPAFAHPLIAPYLDVIQQKVRDKFPEATPAQLEHHSKTALVRIAQQILGPTANNNQEQNRGQGNRTIHGTDEVNWDELMGQSSGFNQLNNY